jgi:hypothetical protein
MSEDSEGFSLEKAIREYDEGLVILKRCGKRRQLESEVAFNAVLKVLMAKDVIAKLNGEQPTSSQIFLDLHRLDTRFDASRKYIKQASRTPYARKLIKNIKIYEKSKWWRALHTNVWKLPFRFLFNDCDLFFKLLTAIILAGAISILINIAPLFFAAGVTPEGAMGVIIPSALTFILGKDTIGQITNGYGILENILRKSPFPIHPVLHQECALLISLLFFSVMIWTYNHLDSFSDCYYNRAMQQSRDSNLPNSLPKSKASEPLCRAVFLASGTGDKNAKSSKEPIELVLSAFEVVFSKVLHISSSAPASQPENDLIRAVKLNPDKASAHLELGWTYELRQDLKNAELHYALASQNGSLLGGSRLAALYLINDDIKSVNKAAVILMQSSNQILKKYGPDGIEEFLEQRSWNTMNAWANLKLGRLNDSAPYIKDAINLYWKIVDNSDIENDSTSAFCAYAELLERSKTIKDKTMLSRSWLTHDSNQRGNVDKKLAWTKCTEASLNKELDDYVWQTRVNKRLPEENKY